MDRQRHMPLRSTPIWNPCYVVQAVNKLQEGLRMDNSGFGVIRKLFEFWDMHIRDESKQKKKKKKKK